MSVYPPARPPTRPLRNQAIYQRSTEEKKKKKAIGASNPGPCILIFVGTTIEPSREGGVTLRSRVRYSSFASRFFSFL